MDQAKKEGIEKGITQKELEMNLAFAKNLLTSTDFSASKITQVVGVNEDFVIK